LNINDLLDIVEPGAIPWTPQTWGWWALLAIALLSLALGVRAYRRHQAANRYRREALVELDALQRPTVSAVNALLKRTAMTADRRDHVASLSGSAWVEFLQSSGPTPGLGEDEQALLGDGGYSSRNVDGGALVPLARAWIGGHRIADQGGG